MVVVSMPKCASHFVFYNIRIKGGAISLQLFQRCTHHASVMHKSMGCSFAEAFPTARRASHARVVIRRIQIYCGPIPDRLQICCNYIVNMLEIYCKSVVVMLQIFCKSIASMLSMSYGSVSNLM